MFFKYISSRITENEWRYVSSQLSTSEIEKLEALRAEYRCVKETKNDNSTVLYNFNKYRLDLRSKYSIDDTVPLTERIVVGNTYITNQRLISLLGTDFKTENFYSPYSEPITKIILRRLNDSHYFNTEGISASLEKKFCAARAKLAEGIHFELIDPKQMVKTAEGFNCVVAIYRVDVNGKVYLKLFDYYEF